MGCPAGCTRPDGEKLGVVTHVQVVCDVHIWSIHSAQVSRVRVKSGAAGPTAGADWTARRLRWTRGAPDTTMGEWCDERGGQQECMTRGGRRGEHRWERASQFTYIMLVVEIANGPTIQNESASFPIMGVNNRKTTRM